MGAMGPWDPLAHGPMGPWTGMGGTGRTDGRAGLAGRASGRDGRAGWAGRRAGARDDQVTVLGWGCRLTDDAMFPRRTWRISFA